MLAKKKLLHAYEAHYKLEGQKCTVCQQIYAESPAHAARMIRTTTPNARNIRCSLVPFLMIGGRR